MERITKALINRYIVLRILYQSPKNLENLKRETKLKNIEILQALENLIHNRRITKRKTWVRTERQKIPENEIDIAKSMLGLDDKNRRPSTNYKITERGKKYLSYIEFEKRLFEMWSPASKFYNQEKYLLDMKKLMETQNFYLKYHKPKSQNISKTRY